MLVARIIERNASTKIPMIMKATGLDEKQSFAVFTYVVHGGLAVNRLYEWKKSSEWEEVQPSIQSFIQGGMSQLAAKNNDSLD